jgi:hypothetical protein
VFLHKGIALRLQNRLEESKQKMFMSLRIFTEEALIEESSSVISCSSVCSSLSTSSGIYSVSSSAGNSNAFTAHSNPFSQDGGLNSFMLNDYLSKKKEVEPRNRRYQESVDSTSQAKNHTPFDQMARDQSRKTFSPIVPAPSMEKSNEWTATDLDDFLAVDAFPSAEDEVRVHGYNAQYLPREQHQTGGDFGGIERRGASKRKQQYFIESDADFLNAVGDLEEMLLGSSDDVHVLDDHEVAARSRSWPPNLQSHPIGGIEGENMRDSSGENMRLFG